MRRGELGAGIRLMARELNHVALHRVDSWHANQAAPCEV